MVDTISLLVSHGMLVALVWRLTSLRDPEEPGTIRYQPGKNKA